MGLVVIIILVVLGFLIYLVLSLHSPEKSVKSDFENDQLAQNFLSSWIKTDASCGHSIRELITYCVLKKEVYCESKNACDFVNQTTTKMLEKTLKSLGYAYHMQISRTGFNYSNKNCGPNSDKGTQGFEVVSLYPLGGDVLITLDICR